MDVPDLFAKVAERMRADLEAARSALTHPGMKGLAFEESFRSFLRTYLPRALDVSTGILVDSHGGQSRQLDVIVSDAAKTPVFFSSGEMRVIPVECAYMVIEVKAHLDSSALGQCFENMKSVRQLKKSAFLPQGIVRRTVRAYGADHEIWPVNYFVFAYDSIEIMQLGLEIIARTEADNLPPESRLDTVCVLDKGVICSELSDGTFDALPEPGCKWRVCRTRDSLLLFYALTSRYFNQAWLPDFRFTDYLGAMTFEDLPPEQRT